MTGPKNPAVAFEPRPADPPRITPPQATHSDAQSRLKDLERLVSDWLWECDPDLNLTYSSARSSQLLGRHPLTLQGQNLLSIGEFFTDFLTEQRADPPEQLSRRAPFRDVCFLVRDQNGQPKMLLLSGLPCFHETTQDFLGYRGTARDITDEIEARRQENDARHQLINAIEAIDDGFALFDKDEMLIFANSRIRELCSSCDCAELLENPGSKLADFAKAYAQLLTLDADPQEIGRQTAQRLEEMRAGDVSFDHRDGDRWIRVKEKHIPSGGIVSIRTDITDLINRETAIRHAKEDAELANRTKTEFLANISHELRTPLNAIIGFAEVMHDELFGKLGNARYKQYSSDIRDSGRHLLSIINDILDVSKAEAGKLELFEESARITKIIQGASRLIDERATQGEVKIHQEIADDLPAILVDERKIKQIMLNLLSNAVKFTEPGGTVTVRVGLAADGDLLISTTDTGIGMSEDQIAIALTPFGQIDNTFSRSNQGTGLGLPLCHALATLHDATLIIESVPGTGTTVHVKLPKSRLLTD